MRKILVIAMVTALACFLITGTLAANGSAAGQGTKKADMSETRLQLRECIQVAENLQAKQGCITQTRTQNREKVLANMGDTCANLQTGTQNQCMSRVNAIGACWSEEPGLDRATCAKEQLGLSESVQAQVGRCKTGENQTQCMEQLRANVYNYVSFRFQGLSERAEDLIDEGVDEQIVEDFVETLGELETQFDETETLDGKKAALAQVRSAWRNLVQDVNDGV